MSDKQYQTNQLNRLKNSKYGFNIVISDYEGNTTNNMRLTESLVTGLKILLDDNEEYLLYIKDKRESNHHDDNELTPEQRHYNQASKLVGFRDEQ